jgi:thiamine-monophosphate kinase
MREFDLLQRVYAANAALPARVTIPPGDDMGAVRIGDRDILVTVDQVGDGMHFRLEDTPIAKIGRKAITRNLSDVAAMAALPVGAVAAACLPRGFGEDRATELFEAMRTTGAAYNCPLIGGDVAIWDHPLLLSVTILGEAAGVTPVRRSGALVGDVIYVTGDLGGSMETVDGRCKHLDFEPRLSAARALASSSASRPRAMIDLSDGLARDLGHICRASGVAAEVQVADLPVSKAAKALARRTGQPPWRHALADGEDYELCFTVAANAEVPSMCAGVPITRIGKIVAAAEVSGASPVRLRMADGTTLTAEGMGWEHEG